jgi:mono/diheme cytochrome c family protein
MRMLSAGLLAGAATAALAIAISATATGAPKPIAGTKVDNFMLADQQGVGQELYYFRNNPAVVIVSIAPGDAASKKSLAALDAIRAPYEKQGVIFFALDSTKDANPLGPLTKAPGVSVLNDDLQLVGRSLGVTQTGEAFVVDTKTFTVAYHGPVADTKNKQASVATALDALIAGKAAPVVEAKVTGKPIDFADRRKAADFAKISYAKDVAPILADKCVACHTKGGVGPFAMNSYEVVKGFAPMIREAIRSKRMPPYQSDRHGSFKNDLSLSDAQILTLVNWVEAGAPRGEGEDPLPKVAQPAPQWPYGQPDVVLDLPSFDVPASGIVPYQHLIVKNPMSEAKFLKSVVYHPGATQALHHIVAGWNPEGKTSQGQGWEVDTGGWGPGSDPTRYPADTGNKVGANGQFVFQMHYTPNGKAQTDKTQVGIYYAKEPPNNILRQLGIADFSIEIPAGEARHHERGYVEFPADVMLYAVRPHAHSRAYASRLTIRYPDGREEILHNQPRYDFNWQREYVFKDWLPVPKGSILIADYIYDNSPNNVSNPDPKKDVLFGEQTFEEMLFTYLHYKIVGEDREHPRDDIQAEITKSLSFSVLDDNVDRKLQPEELRGKRMERLKAAFTTFDKNNDGGLDKAEYYAAQAAGRSRPADRTTAAPAPATTGQ